MADLVQYYGTGRRSRRLRAYSCVPAAANSRSTRKECDVYFVTPQQRPRPALACIADIGETFDVITTCAAAA